MFLQGIHFVIDVRLYNLYGDMIRSAAVFIPFAMFSSLRRPEVTDDFQLSCYCYDVMASHCCFYGLTLFILT